MCNVVILLELQVNIKKFFQSERIKLQNSMKIN
jgi:hypothetical protein